ncbi:nuclear transport factor 2 family protein [Streptomyces sp. CHD11]|uniref:nuclear transport factor 2 family protein n=1 Tax=Streptomyces sp. CHD11 TaxID=2741325 RepID=UPI001BFC5962|nr:nuclear transport factor 2 family protein [Streptomyces sp. CHD11]MBT3151295.1 nuclear transport factor 2 family protein [Streptomyces sp. CHD11]
MTPTWLPRRGGSPKPAGPGNAAPAAPDLASTLPEGAATGNEGPGGAGPEGEGPEAGSREGGKRGSEDTEAGRAEGAPGDAPARRLPEGRLRRAAAGGVAVALVLGGCGFFYAAHQLRSAAPAQNRALTDTEATTRVAGDVGNALARVFSYTPDGTAAAERSARTVLDGRAARQYATLFDRVRDDLTEQRLTLSTRAVRTGVVELDGDRARLLVFLDQTSRRGAAGVSTAAAQLTVTARLEGDRWRIVDIKAR